MVQDVRVALASRSLTVAFAGAAMAYQPGLSTPFAYAGNGESPAHPLAAPPMTISQSNG
jgi:hypothetical protein